MAYHRPIVLIVEDEPFITMLYEEIVTDAGLWAGPSPLAKPPRNG